MAKRTSSKDSLARYKHRISASKKWRETEGYDELWNRLKDMYAGKMYEDISEDDRLVINLAFATVNVIGPSIATNHPKTTVFARDPENEDRAVITEAVLDFWWRCYEIKPEFRLAVDDFLVIGHGWLKTGYKYREEATPLGQGERDKVFEEKRAEADAYAEQNPEMAGDLPTDDEIAANLPETRQVISQDRPFVERVSPHDVFVDPEATKITDLKWVAQRVIRPLEDVKSDDRYDVRARNAVGGDLQVPKSWLAEDRMEEYGDDIKRCTVWEFYDVKDGTMSVFTENGESFLVKPTPMPYKFGHPFIMIRNYDVPDVFYPIGDLEAIEPLQRELNKTRSQLMNMRKQYARKHLYVDSVFDAQGREALEDPTDGRMIAVNLEGSQFRSLSEVIAPLPINSVDPQLFQYSSQIEQDISTVTGVSDYQRGSAPEIRRTATEASMIQDAVNARSADKLAIIETAIAEISKNLVELARQYLTGEQVARVVGKNGKPLWVPYEHDDLDGEYDFEVEAGSTMPKNEAWKQQNAMQLLQALGPMVGTVLDPAAIARFVLQSFGVKNPEEFMAQQPPPGALPPGAEQQQPQQGGTPPGAPPEPDMGPPPAGMEHAPDPGPSQIPPEVLQQLQGQVGLNF